MEPLSTDAEKSKIRSKEGEVCEQVQYEKSPKAKHVEEIPCKNA